MPLSDAQVEELRRAAAIYHPCDFGVHVCGSDDIKNAALTVANIPTRNEADARRVFAACKAEAEAQSEDEHDLVVDLNIGPYELHVEDFYVSRQMLARCLEAGRRALSEQGE